MRRSWTTRRQEDTATRPQPIRPINCPACGSRRLSYKRLAVLQRLLRDVAGGLLEEHLGPISKRIEQLMRNQRLNLTEAAHRLRFLAIAARPGGPAFLIAAPATLQRRHGREVEVVEPQARQEVLGELRAALAQYREPQGGE